MLYVAGPPNLIGHVLRVKGRHLDRHSPISIHPCATWPLGPPPPAYHPQQQQELAAPCQLPQSLTSLPPLESRLAAQVTAAAEGSSDLNEVLAQACNVYLESARQQWDAAGGGQLALGREVLGAMQQPLPAVGGGQLASGRKAPGAVSAVAGPRQPALPPRAARKGGTGQQ